jgi:hypothetical protein
VAVVAAVTAAAAVATAAAVAAAAVVATNKGYEFTNKAAGNPRGLVFR